jgi:hypothetical protein
MLPHEHEGFAGWARPPTLPVRVTRSDQPRGTSASARMGEPVPLLIFKGAAIRIAPLAGS